MTESKELSWNDVPEAHRVHCWLEAKNPWRHQSYTYQPQVIFQQDDGHTGCWETTLLPADEYGPSHVIYFRERIEVWRYWTPDSGCLDIVATINWDDPDLLEKVLTAATGDMLDEWRF